MLSTSLHTILIVSQLYVETEHKNTHFFQHVQIIFEKLFFAIQNKFFLAKELTKYFSIIFVLENFYSN